MKRAKSLLTALAAIIGIGGSIAATRVTTYDYTLTTGSKGYEYNPYYNALDCVPGAQYCLMTCSIQFSGAVSGSTIIAEGGHGYNAAGSYGY